MPDDPDNAPSFPLDAGLLVRRISDALERAGAADPALADSIAFAVENAMREQGTPADTSGPDSLAARILRDVGQPEAAGILEAAGKPEFTFHPEEEARIRAFLRKRFSVPEEELERAEKKVMHTLFSIGADPARSALVEELARHFLQSGKKEAAPAMPFRTGQTSRPAVTAEKIAQTLTDIPARGLLRRRILAVVPFDPGLFPVLKFEIRLSPLKKELPPGPLTELALAPSVYRIADAMDAICLAADAVCSAMGCGSETPLKTALHFPDAARFVREVMGCKKGDGAAVSCIAGISSLFRSGLTRQPLRITFHPETES